MRTKSVLHVAAAAFAGAAAFAATRRLASRMNLEGRSALITGGSRGLGLAIARELGRLGAHVTLAARDEAELEAAREDLASRGIGVSTLICDLTDRAEGRRIVEQTVAERGRLDIIVNNAGVIQVGPVAHMHDADFTEAMDLHFWAPLQTMLAAIPVMRRQGGGRIVNISSIGGKIGVAHMVPYCASKFALVGLSTAMHGELVKDGILVTTVSPGLMRTGSPFNARFKGRHREEFAWFTVSDSLPLLTIDAARAARQIVDACRCGDAELVVSWPAKLAVVANAIFPAAVALGMRMADALLPPPSDASGDRARSGWQSLSSWAPSRLTRLTERAAMENNQLQAGSFRTRPQRVSAASARP
jgi:NAD(P)-dependent dehydrogenase (short-subunit alcohol dehydrogenase family)